MSDQVEWRYRGKPDLAVGTGASAAERLLVHAAGAVAALAFVPLWLAGYQGWDGWVYLVCAVVAFDIVGGVVANATNSCKRFYHTPADPQDPGHVRFLKSGINFALLHVHTILLGTFIPGSAGLLVGLIWYLGLIASVVAVRATPLYLQRPVAFALIVGAILANQYAAGLGDGLEWVVPLLFIKIVYGHTVREEPYRPDPATEVA